MAAGLDALLFVDDGGFFCHFLPQLAAHSLMANDSKKPALTVEDQKLKEKKAATTSGLPMPVLSTSEDLGDWNFERDLGFPGEFPYTRGVYPDHVSRTFVDHAAIRRIRHRSRIECSVIAICSSAGRTGSR